MREVKVFIVYLFSIYFLRFKQELYQSQLCVDGIEVEYLQDVLLKRVTACMSAQ
jgi:hypothetical protein